MIAASGKRTIESLGELPSFSRELANLIRPGDLVLLRGPMGVGKTTLVREIARAWGSREVASPTYAIHHRYYASGRAVEHIDLYRLTDSRDLESAGFWDLISTPEVTVFIEWADRLDPAALPANRAVVEVSITMRGDGAREFIWRRRD